MLINSFDKEQIKYINNLILKKYKNREKIENEN